MRLWGTTRCCFRCILKAEGVILVLEPDCSGLILDDSDA